MQWMRSHISQFFSSFLLFLLQACGGSSSGGGISEPSIDLADARAFKTNALYSNVIADCIRANSVNNFCSLETLPIIGLETNAPTIEDIMDRVVVSHDWMGQRFEQILGTLPPEMLTLFQAVTAIVIDSDIRPSRYLPGTGAIYLAPYYLWLSVDEKRTVSLKEDFRSGFDDALSFRVLNRYLKNGQYAFDYASLTNNSTRTINDIEILTARILLHELAHANDFIPPGSFNSLMLSQNLAQAFDTLQGSHISYRLMNLMPIESSTMLSLAGVMYRGNTPSNADLTLSASEVGGAFEPDGASDDYAYTSRSEDIAMLFESTMMKYFFDVDHEIAFTNVPENPYYCDYYNIAWGAIGRIGDSNVKPRAQFAVSEILPNMNFALFFQNLDAPVNTSGSWCPETSSSLSASKRPILKEMPMADRTKPYL